ncbi:hypothetical protein [Limimaricola cinnabarinus]|uniref:hypothetical protein n=1 Tax=Limimaricola cinnabarinus TaxID=1125964 RepID=UPI002490DF5F|nr:hypothetical protein [Limimaricola cinnabarinus]
MLSYLRHAIRAVRRAFLPSIAEERTVFDHVWVILLASGIGIVLILTYKLLFPA